MIEPEKTKELDRLVRQLDCELTELLAAYLVGYPGEVCCAILAAAGDWAVAHSITRDSFLEVAANLFDGATADGHIRRDRFN